jgi:hypothetical protein
VQDPNYPNIGVGGPVDGCTIERTPLQGASTRFMGPLSGSNDTFLLTRSVAKAPAPEEIFADGFESGDLSAWSCD